MQIDDSITGDELAAYIFVSSMTYSGYSYVEARLDMKSESWINAHVIAALKNQQFFSLNELNDAIKEELELFNNKDFQKKEGSRKSLYLTKEQGLPIPLPTKDFELSNWKIATVQLNYHISIKKMHYSVPYEYLKHKVDVE